jgi:hypothetical protein
VFEREFLLINRGPRSQRPSGLVFDCACEYFANEATKEVDRQRAPYAAVSLTVEEATRHKLEQGMRRGQVEE